MVSCFCMYVLDELNRPVGRLLVGADAMQTKSEGGEGEARKTLGGA